MDSGLLILILGPLIVHLYQNSTLLTVLKVYLSINLSEIYNWTIVNTQRNAKVEEWRWRLLGLQKKKDFFIQAKSDISKADASSCFSADLLEEETAALQIKKHGGRLCGYESGEGGICGTLS